MVDKESPADGSSWVDLDTGGETADVGDHATCEPELMPPEKVGDTMKPQRM